MLLSPNENKISHRWRNASEKQWRCFHNLKRGCTPDSGWLHRMVKNFESLFEIWEGMDL
jgi:hypothetical protein